MGYISTVRKKVGHDELMIVGGSVIIVKDGQTLLQRRKDNGLWAIHGGCVEPGERTEDAARREMREETGLVAGALTLLGVYSGEDMRYTYPNGDRVSIADIVYVCHEFSGDLSAQEGEVTGLEWFPLDCLPPDDAISPINLRVIRDYARHFVKSEAQEG